MKSIVIIGNGIAGITAARSIRKLSDDHITVVSSESEYFYSRTALMYIYMGHMRYEDTKPYEDGFWKKNKINLLCDHVLSLDTKSKSLQLQSNKALKYDVLVIATGSKPNKFGWPGENLKGVQGLYSLQDLSLMEENTKGIERAVIVGGGLIGVEMAEMLLSRNIAVTFLIREKDYWSNVLPPEEAAMISRHVQRHHVNLCKNTALKEIVPDSNHHVKAVITDKGEVIDCQFVGITAGVSPGILFLEGSAIETDRGVLINEYFETNAPDVYAIGDCAQFKVAPKGRKNIEQVWYTGRMHGETVAHTICNKKTAYKPGIWFNSAKFFDIEYQVYGDVNNSPGPEEEHLYWEHPDGEKSIRLVYEKRNKAIKGFNLMGIRYRHEVCDRWIRTKQHIDYVLAHLKEANFDPEFSNYYERELMKIYEKSISGAVSDAGSG